MKIVLTESQFNRVFLFENDEDISGYEETDKITPYLKEKIFWLWENEWGTVLEPVIEMIKEEKGQTIDPELVYNGYGGWTDDEYKLIYDYVKRLYGDIINVLNSKEGEFKKERLRRIEIGDINKPVYHGRSSNKKNDGGGDAKKVKNYLEYQWLDKIKGYPTELLDNKTIFEMAQKQWKIWYNGPTNSITEIQNPETGRVPIPMEVIKNMESIKDFLLGKMKQNQSKHLDLSHEDLVRLYGDFEQGGIRIARKDANFNSNSGYETFSQEKLNREEKEKIESDYPVEKIYEYNQNIREQKNLIPKYCKKSVVKNRYYKYICGDTGDKCTDAKIRGYETLRKKYNGKYGWFNSNKSKGITRYGYYLTYTADIGKDPFVECNNNKDKGVWVYDTEAGPWCGCYNIDNRTKYLDEHGTHSQMEYLGFLKQVKEWEEKVRREKGLNQKLVELADSISKMVNNCTSDYHCLIDIASIVSLAIPYIGPMVSMGFDLVNAATYGIEGASGKISDEEAAMGVTFSLFGALMGGGYSRTKNLIKAADDPKIYQYINDVAKDAKLLSKGSNKSIAQMEEEMINIYAKNADAYKLTDKQILQANSIISELKNLDVDTVRKYTKALMEIESRVGRSTILSLKDNKILQNAVKESGGDLVVGLNKAMKSAAFKEGLIETGMFVSLMGAMESPEVANWLAGKIGKAQEIFMDVFKGGSIKLNVQNAGYNWEMSKELFGSDGSGKDNELLGKAWNAGWRPYPESKKDLFNDVKTKNKDYTDYIKTTINIYKEKNEKERLEDEKGKILYQSISWILERPKYQTSTFKEKYASYKISQEDIEKSSYQKTKKYLKKFKDMTSEEIKNMFAKMSDEERKKWIEENLK